MPVRGIRGAITVESNTKEAIISETKQLLEKMLDENNIHISDIASIFFSVTKDLDAEFPAIAARQLELTDTPLLCLNEIPVPGSLEKCVRILMHTNTDTEQADVQHVYLKKAASLRPEFGQNNDL